MSTTPKFEYPDSATPTTTIDFPEGGRLVPDAQRHRLNQLKDRTKDGKLMVASLGSGIKQFPFTARFKMSSPAGESHETDLADVLDFIDNTVEGGVNTFDWTDSEEVVRTVNIVNDDFTFKRFGEDTFCCTFLLEVE